VIFQDFPGPEIFKKKSRTFQEAWEPCCECDDDAGCIVWTVVEITVFFVD